MSNMELSGAVCRSCGAALTATFADLGLSPISNAFPRIAARRQAELFYPLRAFVCSKCRLVQLEDFESREVHFNEDYAYFSSVSTSWLAHAARYATAMIDRFELGAASRVIEIASNDGYLLKNFVARGIACLGVDPAANCAEAAMRNFNVETRVGFFGAELGAALARDGWQADLIAANNVLAHVPDPNDFVSGFANLLKPAGTATFEFPHLLELVRHCEFDTIYHEHYSYLSLLALEPLFARAGLRVYDAEKLSTHGGSLRLFVCHQGAPFPETGALEALRAEELAAGLHTDGFYTAFAESVRETKRRLLKLLIELKTGGARICGYGAAAKGTTLLNYCGIKTDILDFVVDRNPHKQGRFVPGTGIPILGAEAIDEHRPDYILILPWNIRQEIVESMSHVRQWGAKFIVPIPSPCILD
ncbi:methyltransferase family protein [Bosea psychrotolerans]|uniref:Methyltransferase family protein n=2 Tax=Bosea psychrotolerans TaxID=1871628 RepID=A0A2S4LY15_9HYPH|nr:methyltransferase family protein [Bosea psychrotolerans]